MFDVTISGLGLAGLSALKALKDKNANLRVAAIEKQNMVAERIECAEGIAAYLMPFLPFKLNDNALQWKIKGMKLNAFNETITRTGMLWNGFTLNRRILQENIFNEAKNNAEILFNSTIVEINQKKEFLELKLNNKKTIKTRFLIASDGIKSNVFKILFPEKKVEMADVKNVEMHNLKLENPLFEEIYFTDATPLGYGYIFPKSKKTANIGIGGINTIKKIEDSFNEFIEMPKVKKQLENARIIEDKSGSAPLYVPEKINTENIIFVGDAANHNLKPFLEGIIPAIRFGYDAGIAVINAVAKEKELNKAFEERIDNALKKMLEESNDLMVLLRELYSSKNENKHALLLGLFSNCLTKKEINALKKENKEKIMKKIKTNKNKAKVIEAFYALSLKMKAFRLSC